MLQNNIVTNEANINIVFEKSWFKAIGIFQTGPNKFSGSHEGNHLEKQKLNMFLDFTMANEAAPFGLSLHWCDFQLRVQFTTYSDEILRAL